LGFHSLGAYRLKGLPEDTEIFRVRSVHERTFRSKASMLTCREHSVYRCPTHSECRGYRACRFAASVHPLRQCGFLLVERLGTTDVLTT
jgi:hypothetical protein